MPNRREAVRDIIERMELADRRDQLAGQLSGGWKQRLALAACVLHRAQAAAARRADRRRRRQGAPRILGPDPRHGRRRPDRAGRRPTTWTRPSAATAIVYLANGHIVVQGGADDVARRSGLITFEATGARRGRRRRARMRRMPGVEAAAVFGRALHVAGTDRAALERAIAVGSAPTSPGARSSRGWRTCSSIC